ncbi:uncharacterized protein LOC101745248 [Bombyx mori]
MNRQRLFLQSYPGKRSFGGGNRGPQPQPPGHHSTTTRRSVNMVNLSVRLLTIFAVGVLADPAPGRFPKVYNALITSNQNLEPSKAFPVYQPVLHQAFSFPFQDALFYGDFPANNGFVPPVETRDPQPSEATPTVAPESVSEQAPSSTETPPALSPETSSPAPSEDDKTAAPSLPPLPSTQSPIPLNEFGLPPQVLPIGRLDGFGSPAYGGFSQIGPYPYSFPGLRFYDPFDSFSINSFPNFPLYRPLTNVLGQNVPLIPNNGPSEAPATEASIQSTEKSVQTPPPEPSDLNVLNYSSKDPTIPDVPPPPLPQGGLKSDKTE